MSRLRKSLGIAALCGSVGVLSSACEDNESMLFILGVAVLDDDCSVDPSTDTQLLASGRFDLTLSGPRPYTAALLVGSQLTARASRDQLRTETARFILEGAEVTVTNAVGELVDFEPNPYSTRGTGALPPASGQNAALGILWAEILPGGRDLPTGVLYARVKAFGRTLGGTEIESGEFVFPIEVCRGCLITYPASAADETAAPVGGEPGRFICRSVGEDTEEASTCLPGQDSSLPCTACSAIAGACEDPCQNCVVREDPRADIVCAGIPKPDVCKPKE